MGELWNKATKHAAVLTGKNEFENQKFNSSNAIDRRKKFLEQIDIILKSSANSNAEREIVGVEDNYYC